MQNLLILKEHLIGPMLGPISLEGDDMQKIDMELLANAVAETIRPHLGKPTTPILSYRKDADVLYILLNDGRKVMATVQTARELYEKKKQPSFIPLTTSKPAEVVKLDYPPSNLKPDGKKRPTKKS